MYVPDSRTLTLRETEFCQKGDSKRDKIGERVETFSEEFLQFLKYVFNFEKLKFSNFCQLLTQNLDLCCFGNPLYDFGKVKELTYKARTGISVSLVNYWYQRLWTIALKDQFWWNNLAFFSLASLPIKLFKNLPICWTQYLKQMLGPPFRMAKYFACSAHFTPFFTI